MGIKKIVLHWSASQYEPNKTDLEHYHFLFNGEGVSPLKAQIMYIAVDFWQWLKNFRTRKWR